MIADLHVHVPYLLLEENFSFLLYHRLQPEIAFKGPDLDRLDHAVLRRVGQKLAAGGLQVTVHAPFMDLNPGSVEPLVQEATSRRYRQALEAAASLGARLIVFHPGFDNWRYGEQRAGWIEGNQRFWPSLIRRSEETGCRMVLENIFESDPGTIAEVLAFFDSPFFGHCFDIGHWHLFGEVSMAQWFTALGARILHLHLHDNFGQRDEHLPVGEGTIDFPALFHLIRQLPVPPRITLEAHSQQCLLRSLAAVTPFFSP
jgi:sugar phosphate isomerase/epimerase